MHMDRLVHESNVKPYLRLGTSLLTLFGITWFQMLGLPQPITGPIVNAALFATALWLGPWHAVGVGLFTPVVAYTRGILAAPLAPMVPIIAMGNGLMVVLFSLALKKVRPELAVAAGSVVKFLLLTTAVHSVVTVPQPVAVMMQWPQLATALAGGCLVLAANRLMRWTRHTR